MLDIASTYFKFCGIVRIKILREKAQVFPDQKLNLVLQNFKIFETTYYGVRPVRKLFLEAENSICSTADVRKKLFFFISNKNKTFLRSFQIKVFVGIYKQ